MVLAASIPAVLIAARAAVSAVSTPGISALVSASYDPAYHATASVARALASAILFALAVYTVHSFVHVPSV